MEIISFNQLFHVQGGDISFDSITQTALISVSSFNPPQGHYIIGNYSFSAEFFCNLLTLECSEPSAGSIFVDLIGTNTLQVGISTSRMGNNTTYSISYS